MLQLRAVNWTEPRTYKSHKILPRRLFGEGSGVPHNHKKTPYEVLCVEKYPQLLSPILKLWTTAQNYPREKQQQISVPINAKHLITNRPSSAVSFHVTIDSDSFLVGTDIHGVYAARVLMVLVFPLVTVFRSHACTKRNMTNSYNHLQLLLAMLTINKIFRCRGS